LKTVPVASETTILLVDDDRLVLLTLARGLSSKGYRVITADSAEEAETLLIGGERPGLAVLDVNLPGKSGLDLAQRLQMLDQIPFIFLSAYSDQEFIETANKYGALSYLLKPIDPEQLMPVVESALARAVELKLLKASERSLQNALKMEREISLAIGVTMMQYHLGRKEAFELLRNTARSRRIKLASLATEVIAAAETLNLAASRSA
jgi:two-component system, response regulator PdtaR